MPRISDPPIQPVDIWTYATRTLTSHAFPFTNPASPVDLPNVQQAISPTGTGREAKLDNIDKKVSEAVPVLARGVMQILDLNRVGFKAVESVAGDSFSTTATALTLTKGGTDGELHVIHSIPNSAIIFVKATLRISGTLAGGLIFQQTGGDLYMAFISGVGLRLYKRIAGTWTVIATYSFTPSLDTDYVIEFYVDGRENRQIIVLDGTPRIDASDTSLTNFDRIGARANAAYQTVTLKKPILELVG